MWNMLLMFLCILCIEIRDILTVLECLSGFVSILIICHVIACKLLSLVVFYIPCHHISSLLETLFFIVYFQDFMEGKLPSIPGELPTLNDWENHLTTIFPEVS
uniref:Uncharacterized protein n=1 Tax=Nelumbo nucifera TaxID=4432 RepID=A0A822ZMZ6_NELNU|nr:TPA_asm: hypothetical protein HUJ06_017311 [Nelumbo nucifera]